MFVNSTTYGSGSHKPHRVTSTQTHPGSDWISTQSHRERRLGKTPTSLGDRLRQHHATASRPMTFISADKTELLYHTHTQMTLQHHNASITFSSIQTWQWNPNSPTSGQAWHNDFDPARASIYTSDTTEG